LSLLLGIVGERPDVAVALQEGLERVSARLDERIFSDLLAVQDLVGHVERYRGKMIRPALTLLAGMAAAPTASDAEPKTLLRDEHVVVGAVIEMIHLATLVHDDVLDEADLRRRGATLNRLRGNETAVILGDYLISKSFHLCSTLDEQATALRIGEITNRVCEGELLQLHNRDDLSLDETTYMEIIERKTAALLGVATELGAKWSGADDAACRRMERFGLALGVAFQIRDDLLDLTGEQEVVGKSLGKDIEKGKLTLPVIHHLRTIEPAERGASLRLLEAFSAGDRTDPGPAVAALRSTGSIEYAAGEAARLAGEAKAELEDLPDSPARSVLLRVADAVVTRSA